ncbi:FMN-dependent NADH-azoreductase [Algicella marina]
MTTILQIDSSMRREGSTSRKLTSDIVSKLREGGDATVIHRDLADGIEIIDESWIGANFTPAEDRSDDHLGKLAASEELVSELEAADIIVIGVPVYNFGVPAALKAWVDLVARARRTFQYTEAGPEGLLKGKRAILAIASGGTAVDSDVDFTTPYLRHVLAFLGITDVSIVAADLLMVDPAKAQASAEAAIAGLAAA